MHILITAGPTQEYFDSVRFVSNSSSGKMGYALANEAVGRGHEVTLVSGPVERRAPAGVKMVRVVSAREMFDAAVSAFGSCEVAIMTAAVCDYRPSARSNEKMEKSPKPIAITLEPTDDICAHLGKIKGRRVVVGFAMEDHDHRRHAEEKLKRKRCDAIVLNSVASVGGDLGELEILRVGVGWGQLRRGTKAQLASTVIDLVEELTG